VLQQVEQRREDQPLHREVRMAQDHRDHQLLELQGADLAVLLRLLRPPEKDRDRLVLEEGRQKAALVSLQWVRRSDGCTLLLGAASIFGEGEQPCTY